MEGDWRYLFIVICGSFIISWFAFGMLYYGAALMNCDLDPDYLAAHPNHTVCASNVYSITTAFLFSLETQNTIGYGYRCAIQAIGASLSLIIHQFFSYVTPACPLAVILVCVQSIFGIVMETLITGLVLTKLLRPKKRSQEIVFSKNACLVKKDNDVDDFWWLEYRVADMDSKTHLAECHVRLYLVAHPQVDEFMVALLFLTTPQIP